MPLNLLVRAVWTILGVSRYQQWREHITTDKLSEVFGMQWSIADFIMERRLCWLGHLGCMADYRLPNNFCLQNYRESGLFMGPRNDGVVRCCLI